MTVWDARPVRSTVCGVSLLAQPTPSVLTRDRLYNTFGVDAASRDLNTFGVGCAVLLQQLCC